MAAILGTHRRFWIFPKLSTSRGGHTRLDSLNYVGGIIIDNNPVLYNLSSLGGVHSVEFGIGITDNKSLPNLKGLKNVFYIGSTLYVRGNESLTNLDGLENLALIDGNLNMRDNDSLSDISALSNLSYVNGDFIIINNAFANISPLIGLSSINGSIIIRGNDVLSNLNGLKNINPLSIQSTSGAEDIEIQNNPMLSTCAVESICEALILPWISTDIYNNAPGCDTVSEILDACISPVADIKTERKRNRTVSKSGTG